MSSRFAIKSQIEWPTQRLDCFNQWQFFFFEKNVFFVFILIPFTLKFCSKFGEVMAGGQIWCRLTLNIYVFVYMKIFLDDKSFEIGWHVECECDAVRYFIVPLQFSHNAQRYEILCFFFGYHFKSCVWIFGDSKRKKSSTRYISPATFCPCSDVEYTW